MFLHKEGKSDTMFVFAGKCMKKHYLQAVGWMASPRCPVVHSVFLTIGFEHWTQEGPSTTGG